MILLLLGVFGIFVLSLVLLVAVLVFSFRKSIIVFYDISDALLSSIVYIIASVVTTYVAINSLNQGIDGLYKSYTIPVTGLCAFISLVMIFYSFFAAYYYNKPKKGAIFLSFLGRYVIISFLINIPGLLVAVSRYTIGGYTGGYYIFLILIEAVVIFVIVLLICRFLVYKSSMSDMSYYVDFKRIEALGKEFREMQKAKREERLRIIQERRTAAMNRPR